MACIYLDCAPQSDCITQNHIAQCVCPAGYTGNPYGATGGCKEIDLDECKRDTDCAYTRLCRPDIAGIKKCIGLFNWFFYSDYFEAVMLTVK